MIPTIVMLGFLAGFHPKGKFFVGVAGLAWPIALAVSDVDRGLPFFIGAGALAAANALTGVLAGTAARKLVTRLRHLLGLNQPS